MSSSASPGDTEKPVFSVIMPAYNRQALLDEAVDSVLAQTCEEWELIIVDDASPEPLRVPDDPRIRLLRHGANSGQATGINTALRYATGEYVAVLADDDAWGPTRLENARRGHELGDVVCCRTTVLGDDDGVRANPALRRIEQSDLRSRELLHSMCAMSVRRDRFPSMDVSYRAAEDLEWGIRLLSMDLRWVLVDSGDFLWRRHDGPRHRNGLAARITGSERLLKEHADYYAKWPRTRAFREYRIGAMLLDVGDRRAAVRQALRSLRVRPNVSAAKLIVRAGLQ